MEPMGRYMWRHGGSENLVSKVASTLSLKVSNCESS